MNIKQVEKALNDIGISIVNDDGSYKMLSFILQEIANKWYQIEDTNSINLDRHVYCYNCRHFRYKNLGTPNIIPTCIHENECDIWDAEDSKPLSQRPHYAEKD